MPFLRINGITIPVSDGGISETRMERAEGARGFMGGWRTQARMQPKRSWNVSTIRLPARTAGIIEATLLGLPEVFAFEGTVYGARGTRPAGSPVPRVNLRPGTAADGAPVASEGKFGGGITVDPATTNILAANQRNVETGVAGFTAIDGATLTQVSTDKYQGAFSLRVVTSAAVNGVRGGVFTTGVAATAATMAASVYVKPTSATTLRLFIRNATLATNGTVITTATLPANTWTRIKEAQVPAGTLVGHLLEVRIEEGSIDSGITFYADALQLQSGVRTTGWADPSYLVNALRYSLRELQGADAFSLSFWSIGAPAGVTVVFDLKDLSDLTRNRLRATSNGATINVAYNDRAASVFANGAAMFTTALTPRLQTFVVRNKLGVGENRITAMSAGAQVFTIALQSDKMDLRRPFVLDFMNDGGASHLNIVILDHLMIHPWALTLADHIALAAATTPPLGAYLTVEGDFIPESSIQCLATIGPSSYDTFQGAAAYENAGRSIAFTLEEL